jgi:TonB-dependent receptor
MKKIITLLLIAFTSITFSQDTGSIAGSLTDKDFNNEPLAFANVIIKETSTGVTSDMDGLYIIEDLDIGIYTLIFSFIGYETVEIDQIIVEKDKVTNVSVPMGASAAALDQVIIKTTTKKESVVSLLKEQKRSKNIKQSIGAEELSQKGIGDAAGAVAKISGVSRQEGGSNIYVRGLGDRYLSTTYNGLSLPSNNIEKKNMDLDLFSSDIIQNVAVSKAYSTSFYGDFAAGNINILAKNYQGNGFLNIDLGTGINTNSINKDFVKSEGTSKFGFYNRYDNNPFAVVLSHGLDPVSAGTPMSIQGSISGGKSYSVAENSKISVFLMAAFDNNYEYRDGEIVDFTTVEKKRFPNTEEYEYSTTTTAMANVDYKINSDHQISFNSLYINSSTDEVGYYGTQGGGTNRDAILNTDEGFYQMNVQFDQDMIFVNQLLGKHQIDDKLNIEWGIGYNKVFARQPDRKRISIEQYNYEFDNDPTTYPTFYNNIPFDNQRYFQNIEDDELNSRLTLNYKASELITLNFGYNGRTKQRNFDNIRYGYDLIEPNTPATDVNNFNDVFAAENIGIAYDLVVFNAIDPEGGIGNVNYPGLPENTYEGNLDVYAGFVDAEITIGEKWLLVPGFRLESFTQKIEYDVINLPPDDSGFRKTYSNFYLPSLNIKYSLTDDQNLRFATSKTVSYPEFKEIAPFVYEDVAQRVGGNPDLLNDPSFSEIYNIDLKYEWFFGTGEVFTAAAFAKQINDPINKVIANDATGTQRYFRTGDKAQVIGTEIELRKNILTNSNETPKLSAGFNATYMYTKQDLKDSNGLFSTTFDRDKEELQGASPLIINADLNYSPDFGNYQPIANLVFSYFSDRIDAIGSGQLGNIIENSIPTLDFIWKNKIGEHLEINASAKNLLDPTITRIRENTSQGDVILSQYKGGINLALQVKYKF